MMPNKTIYVSDSDLPVFEKAQQLAGENLSATIVQALRRFVEAHEKRSESFREITVRAGKNVRSYKRFTGRLLAKGQFGGDKTYESFEVYQTAKDKIVLYSRKMPAWWFTARTPRLGRGQRRWDRWDQWENWPGAERMENSDPSAPWWMERAEYDLEVYDNLETLKERVPEELYNAAASALTGDSAEWLDI